MKKALILLAIVVALFVAAAGYFYFSLPKSAPAVTQDENKPLIGFSLGALREDRWTTDRADFIAKAQQLGATVIDASTDYDVAAQISQIENLITQGVKVLVVVPADSDKIAPAIADAKKAGVKVIAYDRLIKNTDIDFYISYDNVKVGELEAQGILAVQGKGDFAYIGGAPTDNNALLVQRGSMSVLDPKIKSGDIRLVLDQLTPNWDPTVAYQTMKAYLATGGPLDAVVAANDGTAFGVIQALKEKGLAGKIPVSGQDAELSACQQIVQGAQTMTVYKPIQNEADVAAEVAFAMATGAPLDKYVNATTNNGQEDVPSSLLAPEAVDKNNMAETVIKDGFHTYAEIYQQSSSTPGR
ncbi:MAG: substrate-binding domain-containing protein [Candidatus Pacebacteria bacterium]|nr:substrate-binding domain-containing protein [Candidatus Paceibacterota bacterium]